MACTTYLAAGLGGCIGATGVFGWRTQGATGVAAVARNAADPLSALATASAISKALADIQNYLWLDDGSIPTNATITGLTLSMVGGIAGSTGDPLGATNTFDGGTYGGAATVNRLVSGTITPTGTVGDSAASVKQTKSSGPTTSAFNPSVPFTFTSNVTIGSAIVMCCDYGDNGARAISTVTDNLGNTYKQTAKYTLGGQIVEQWAAFNVLAGATTVTITFNQNGSGDFSILELGLAGGGSYNITFGSNSDTGTSHASSNVTNTGYPNAVFVEFAVMVGGTRTLPDTPGTGYTLYDDNLRNAILQAKVVSAVETNNGSWSETTNFGTITAYSLLVVYQSGGAPALTTTTYNTNPGTGLVWRREELFNTCFGVKLASQGNNTPGVLQSEFRVYQFYALATWSTLALSTISPAVYPVFGT